MKELYLLNDSDQGRAMGVLHWHGGILDDSSFTGEKYPSKTPF